MSERIAKVAGWAVTALVVGALGFGLSVATAKPASAMTCADNGWGPVGQQPDQQTCYLVCRQIHGPDVEGSWTPSTGCCVCFW